MAEPSAWNKIKIDLQCGDGAQLNHLPRDSFDSVICIDSAYHFNTRSSFLRGAFDALVPGGHLALTDLILSPSLSLFDRLLFRVIFYLAHVPNNNMVELDAYQRRLEGIGYEDISIDDISDRVFDGLIEFIEARDKSQLRRIFNSEWNGLVGYAKVMKWWSQAGVEGKTRKLSFVLVGARKPSSSPVPS